MNTIRVFPSVIFAPLLLFYLTAVTITKQKSKTFFPPTTGKRKLSVWLYADNMALFSQVQIRPEVVINCFGKPLQMKTATCSVQCHKGGHFRQEIVHTGLVNGWWFYYWIDKTWLFAWVIFQLRTCAGQWQLRFWRISGAKTLHIPNALKSMYVLIHIIVPGN